MDKKNYLIVGGSSGIGLELVKKLAGEGHHITVVSRNSENLKGLDGVTHLSKDVLKDEIKPDELPEQLDGMVYCPGSITLKPFRSLKPENFLEDFQINVLGAVKSLHAASKPMKKAGEASVVLFSTVAVSQGMPFHASIAAAKGALEGLARSLAAEWAPTIRVNCVAPSLTDTPMAGKLLDNEDKRKASAERHPLNRVGTPEEMAGLAHYLLSDQAGWISGQVFGVDGGMSRLRKI